jgi:hypothetical protein
MMQWLCNNFARCAALSAATLAFAGPAAAQDKPGEASITVEQLLKSGWQIAGYASNSDNRSTFILFKNPGQTYLVQCLTGYDVTREHRVFQNCYRLQ